MNGQSIVGNVRAGTAVTSSASVSLAPFVPHGIGLAPTGRCHPSPGHRPGLELGKRQSPEGASYFRALLRPLGRPFRARCPLAI